MKEFAGIDVQAMYPAGAPPKADDWTFMRSSRPPRLEQRRPSVRHRSRHDRRQRRHRRCDLPRLRRRAGRCQGRITVKTDAVREALDYYKRLMAACRPTSPSWDDASNNKFLISGQGSMIINPPSAWAVAERDVPQVAEQLWTDGLPAGPEGPLCAVLAFFWGIWSFSKNLPAAKRLITRLRSPRGREDGDRDRRYDAIIREAHNFQGVGGAGPPPARSITIPTPTITSPVGRGRARAALVRRSRSTRRRRRPR